MTTSELFAALADRGIKLFYADSTLRYRSPPGEMTADLLRQVAAHRVEILDRLNSPAIPSDASVLLRPSMANEHLPLAQRPQCAGRCEMSDWVDDESRSLPDRKYVMCGRCGRFIGYRPIHLPAKPVGDADIPRYE